MDSELDFFYFIKKFWRIILSKEVFLFIESTWNDLSTQLIVIPNFCEDMQRYEPESGIISCPWYQKLVYLYQGEENF